MSPEDVCPRWLSKQLRRQHKDQKFYQLHAEGSVTGTERLERAQRFEIDAPVVCRPCNNEWMSQLESLVKPILIPLISSTTSASRNVAALDCVTIATWFTMKAVILDHLHVLTHENLKPFFSPQQRTALKAHLTPPGRIEVWLGRRDAPSVGMFDAAGFGTTYYELTTKAFRYVRCYVVTFAANELVIQLRALRSGKKGTPVPPSVPFYYNPIRATWSDFLIELWPNLPDPAHWPPRLQLRGRDFNFLRNRQLGDQPS